MLKRKMVAVAFVTLIALISVCWFAGSRREVVRNSLWDGSVAQVKLFLQRNWRDVGPRPLIEWGEVKKTRDGNFLVPCTFRTTARSRPAMIEAVFTFDSEGEFVDVKTAVPPMRSDAARILHEPCLRIAACCRPIRGYSRRGQSRLREPRPSSCEHVEGRKS